MTNQIPEPETETETKKDVPVVVFPYTIKLRVPIPGATELTQIVFLSPKIRAKGLMAFEECPGGKLRSMLALVSAETGTDMDYLSELSEEDLDEVLNFADSIMGEPQSNQEKSGA